MGLRLRKSINLGGGMRLNLSKKGVGASMGVKGARVGFGPRGVRQTASIPGTGISYVKETRYKSGGKATQRTGINNQNESVDSILGFLRESYKKMDDRFWGWQHKPKSIFFTDQVLMKMLYLATQNAIKKWMGRQRNWDVIKNELLILRNSPS